MSNERLQMGEGKKEFEFVILMAINRMSKTLIFDSEREIFFASNRVIRE